MGLVTMGLSYLSFPTSFNALGGKLPQLRSVISDDLCFVSDDILHLQIFNGGGGERCYFGDRPVSVFLVSTSMPFLVPVPRERGMHSLKTWSTNLR